MGDDGSVLLACPICLDTLAAPVALATCCGQSFCRACLDAALANTDACPMCREPLLRGGHHAVTRNRALEEIVARLPPSLRNSVADGGMKNTTALEVRGDSEEHHVLIQILHSVNEDESEEDASQRQGGSAAARGLGRQLQRSLQACTTALRRQRSRRGWWQSVSCRQWRHWCQVHWASLQCVFYVVLFFVFVAFLRVQEEEFAEHHKT